MRTTGFGEYTCSWRKETREKGEELSENKKGGTLESRSKIEDEGPATKSEGSVIAKAVK